MILNYEIMSDTELRKLLMKVFHIITDGTMYHLVGCFRKTDGNNHLKHLLITERDNSSHASSGEWIDWHNWDTYMKAFINRCAIKANSRDLSVFGMSFYGKCPITGIV